MSSRLPTLHIFLSHQVPTRSPGTPDVRFWSSISQAQELEHVHTSEPIRVLKALPCREVSESQASWAGGFLMAAWYKTLYSASHSFSPKGKRLAQIGEMKTKLASHHKGQEHPDLDRNPVASLRIMRPPLQGSVPSRNWRISEGTCKG